VTGKSKLAEVQVPTKLKTDKMADALSPLVTRVAQDEELRAHAKTALDSAKTIYAKIQADGARKAATSKTVTDEVVKAAGELRGAAERLQGRTVRRGGKLRKLVIGAAIAAAAAIGIKKLLGSDEDEFDYEP
jgi:hypothetical protein